MVNSKTIHVGILIYPGCLRSGAVVPLDVFQIANLIGALRPAAKRARIEGHWVSARPVDAMTIEGITFPTQSLDAMNLDALMVPGINEGDTTKMPQVLKSLAAEQTALQNYARRERPLIAGCSSALLLAEAGLLDGRRATTSWWLSNYFRARYPAVKLDADELIVHDGNFISSGGVGSFLDLALWLVGHFSGEALRQSTAKFMVVDSNRSSQAPYMVAAMKGGGHAMIEQARRWLDKRLDQPWTVAQLAEHCHTSPRTLLRRFQMVVGLSPIQYAQQLCVERAKAFLESTALSMEKITVQCGYEDVATFSKVFKRWVNITPKAYRARFGLRY